MSTNLKAHSSYTIIDVVDGLQWQDDAASHPENPKEGWAYYNTKDKCSYIYDGEKWVIFAKDGGDAPLVNIMPSALYFKSTTGKNGIFSPSDIYLYPRFQNATYSNWQYSTDGGTTWSSASGANGLSVATYNDTANTLRISKDSTLYTDAVTSISFRCNTTKADIYDVVSVAKIYDVVDLQIGGTNLLLGTDFGGTNLRYVLDSTSGEGGIHFNLSRPLPAGTQVALKFGLKANSAFNVYWIMDGGNFATSVIGNKPEEEPTDFSDIEVKYTIPQEKTLKRIFLCTAWGKSQPEDWFEIKDRSLKLEIGNTFTDWSPAPEDVVESASSINIMLSNEAHLFEADFNGIPLDETIDIDIVGFKGVERVDTKVGVISGIPSAGMTVQTLNNNSTNTKIQVGVNENLTSVDSGVLTIPITIGDHTINKTFSWSKSKAGSDGKDAPKETLEYCQHSSYATAPSSGWSSEFPTEWDESKPYVWKRTKIEQNDNGEFLTEYTAPQLMSQLEVATIMAQKKQMKVSDWCVANDTSIISGSEIATGTVTAKQIFVDDLSSLNATIGGWEITSNSISKGSTRLYAGDECYASLVDKSVQSPVRIGVGVSPPIGTSVTETYSGIIPSHLKAEYDAGNGVLVDGAGTVIYQEYVDYNGAYAQGLREGREDFSHYGYLLNNEGVMMIVLYKGADENNQNPDLREPFYYEGRATIEGVEYDKWRKIVNPNAGGGDLDVYTWTSTEKQYAYTNVIVENGTPPYQLKFSVEYETGSTYITDVGIAAYCDDDQIDLHVVDNGVSWNNGIVCIDLEVGNSSSSYWNAPYYLEIQYTPIGIPPFQVLEDGSLYASAANISGTIHASEGEIGNWIIGDNGIVATNGKAGMLSGGSDVRFFAGPSSIASENTITETVNINSLSTVHDEMQGRWIFDYTPRFIVNGDSGAVYQIHEATQTGTSIGCNVTDISIVAGGQKISIIMSGEPSAKAIVQVQFVYSQEAASYEFAVYEDGALYANKATISGKIDATEGTIGAWNIGTIPNGENNNIWGNAVYTNSLYSISQPQNDPKEYLAFLRVPETSSGDVFSIRVKDEAGKVETPFYIQKDGHLYASSTEIVGGNIGGWEIGPAHLINYGGTKDESGYYPNSFCMQVKTEDNSAVNALAIGKAREDNWGNAAFRVTVDGELYAANLNSKTVSMYCTSDALSNDLTKKDIGFNAGQTPDKYYNGLSGRVQVPYTGLDGDFGGYFNLYFCNGIIVGIGNQ